MSARTGSGDSLIIGGLPRVDLLPEEVKDGRKGDRIRRNLGFAVVVVLIVSVLAVAAATVQSIGAQASLAAEENRTPKLLEQQTEFYEVRSVSDQLATMKAARELGSSTEIDWKKFVNGAVSRMPESLDMILMVGSGSSPIESQAASAVPLQGTSVATVVFTLQSEKITDFASFVKDIRDLQGFADVTPYTITLDEESLVYEASITVHLSSESYENRFAPEVEEPATADDETTDDGTED